MTNPEELHRRFSGFSWTTRLALLGLLGLATTAAVLFARPAWKSLKHYRAQSFADTARQAHDQGNLGLALQRARAALQLEPQNPELLRLNARYLTEVKSDAALGFWQHLASRPDAPPEDQLDYLEASLAFHQLDRVGPVYSNLCTSATPSARLHRLGALYYLGSGASNTALTLARQAYRVEPTNPTNALLVATLIAPDANDPERTEARARLREVAQSTCPLRLIALRRLVQPEPGDRADREWVVDLLSTNPQPSSAESVLLAEARIRLDPATTASVISNLVAQIPHDDLEMLTLVVDTLARLRRHTDVLQLTPAHRSLQNRTLFQARYQALLALDRHDEAYRLLLQPKAPVPPYDLALAKVRAALEARDNDRRDAHLAELIKACGDSPARLRATAELAEQSGSAERAADAWKQLGTVPGQAALSLRALQRLADRRGDTWTARDFARKALRASAPIPGLPLEIAYYDLLLRDNLDQALAEAQAQVSLHPKDFFARATLALGHLRQGSPEKARAALERFFVEDPQPRAEALAVLAATLGQNGVTRRAREIAEHLPLDRLRPEERELIRPWLIPPASALPD